MSEIKGVAAEEGPVGLARRLSRRVVVMAPETNARRIGSQSLRPARRVAFSAAAQLGKRVNGGRRQGARCAQWCAQRRQGEVLVTPPLPPRGWRRKPPQGCACCAEKGFDDSTGVNQIGEAARKRS